jgi:hypothetical protein
VVEVLEVHRRVGPDLHPDDVGEVGHPADLGGGPLGVEVGEDRHAVQASLAIRAQVRQPVVVGAALHLGERQRAQVLEGQQHGRVQHRLGDLVAVERRRRPLASQQ